VSKPLQIASNFVVMNAEFNADLMPVTDSFYAELEKKYGDFAGRTLISWHSFECDWPTWESHPKGDEIVVLLNGAATMILAHNDGDESVLMSTPGEFVIVPRGTWHTAKVSKSAQMLFITPGEGTDNRELPPGREA
jgi:mannose-6-phosphate isomerase-like protein (cupin superfamily)